MKWLRSWGSFGAGRSAPLGQALFWKFLAAVISGAALSMASVGIEDEEVAVFAGDLDRQAGGAQVEEVQALLRIVLFVFFVDLNSVSLIIDLFLYSFSSLSRYSFLFFMPSPPCAIIRRFVREILDTVDKRPTHLYSTQNNIQKKDLHFIYLLQSWRCDASFIHPSRR